VRAVQAGQHDDALVLEADVARALGEVLDDRGREDLAAARLRRYPGGDDDVLAGAVSAGERAAREVAGAER
jgi:hypothetical protein